MSDKKTYNGTKIQNKTKYVLLFTFIFLLFSGFTLLSNDGNSHSLPHQLKKESTIGKAFSVVNSDINSAISLEDLDLENLSFITYKTFHYFEISLFDNRSSILQDRQIRVQSHLPLFLRYHAIKIP